MGYPVHEPSRQKVSFGPSEKATQKLERFTLKTHSKQEISPFCGALAFPEERKRELFH